MNDSAPILLQCSSSFRPEDAKIAEVVRCWMFFEPSFGLFAIFDGIFAVSKLNCHTPMNKVWNMVQKIKGKNNKTNVHHLKDGHDTLTSEQDISNKLGQIFSQNSSTQVACFPNVIHEI
jgi:hypothetical protein